MIIVIGDHIVETYGLVVLLLLLYIYLLVHMMLSAFYIFEFVESMLSKHLNGELFAAPVL